MSHGASDRVPIGSGMGVAILVAVGSGAPSPAGKPSVGLGVVGPKGNIQAGQPALLIGLFQRIRGEPPFFNPGMKLFLGFLLIQPERDNPLGRNTAFLLFYIHLGRSAHGADRGRIVLAEQDLGAAVLAEHAGSSLKRHVLGLPAVVAVQRIFTNSLMKRDDFVGRPAGFAAVKLPLNIVS